MSTGKVDLLHTRLKEELERLGLKPAAAARAAGEPDSQGLRDVLGGRKRLSADLLAALAVAGIDVRYVISGIRQSQGIGEPEIHQAVLDAVDLLSLDKKIDAQQLAKAVVKLCAKAAQPDGKQPPPSAPKISVGTNHGQVVEGGMTNHGVMRGSVFNNKK